MNYIRSINKFLFDFLKDDKKNIILGEDILDPYGGAFKATKGLSTNFPNQVISTPVSEAAITGIGTGLALKGHKVILEIMFGDFITLSADQIVNGISKFLDLSNHKFGNYIIRCPMGGYRGYGATHSQSLESMYLNIPNLEIYSPNIYSNPYELLKYVIKKEKLALFIEHKISYPKNINTINQNNFRLIINDGNEITKINILDRKADFTILTYGYCSELAVETIQEIFLKNELLGEVISFKKIKNNDGKFLNQITSESIFTLEEAISDAGWGKYISNTVYKKFHKNLKNEIINIGSKNKSIPSSFELEKIHLPNKHKIKQIIEDKLL